MIRANTDIGANLRRRRMEKGLSQRDVAERMGVTPQQIQKYEYGTSRVSADALLVLADILDASILDLLSRPSEDRTRFQALADLSLLNEDVSSLVDLILEMDQVSRQRLLSFAQLVHASAITGEDMAA